MKKRNFSFKTEKASVQKKGKREYLNDLETKDFSKRLNDYFEAYIDIPRIKVGEKQTIETLVSEEALLLAKFVRHETCNWNPRMGIPQTWRTYKLIK